MLEVQQHLAVMVLDTYAGVLEIARLHDTYAGVLEVARLHEQVTYKEE